ncbi:MAG: UbiA family prenyltransferase [Candidatus Bathyarchaeota archaeon]|nr:MAG: UbiA family prenyltransferase [Candidatus Bathyarchaeota archaeon]
MTNAVKSLAVISRSEFLLPNLGSLIMGLAWGANPPLGLIDGVILIALSFSIINLSSAIGAQANTLSDYELDLRDERKTELVQALDSFGHRKVQIVLVIEGCLALVLVSTFMLIQQKAILLPLWIAGISLGIVYSAPPLRLKSRSWIAPVSLILVLAIFPVLFAFYTFTFEINTFFLISLGGLALTIYGVIIPTEIRDYFGDKAMNIITMTVRLGLARATLLGIILLSAGAVLTGTALFLEWSFNQQLSFSIFILAMPIAVVFVLAKFKKLYALSKEYETANDQNCSVLEEKIVNLSSDNPKWIMLVTQTYSLLSIMLLVSKFIF